MLPIVHLIGYLSADPETTVAGSGSVTRVNIAVTQRYNDKSGATVEKTHWYKAEVWNAYGASFAKYARKGDRISVVSELLTNSWTTPTGEAKKSTFLRITQWQIIDRKADRVARPVASAETSAPSNPNGPSPVPIRTSQPQPMQKSVPQPSYHSPVALPNAGQQFSTYSEGEDDLPF